MNWLNSQELLKVKVFQKKKKTGQVSNYLGGELKPYLLSSEKIYFGVTCPDNHNNVLDMCRTCLRLQT